MGDEGAGGSHSRDWIHEPLSKMSISDPGAVMDLLNCQSCSEPMYPPIYQCMRGHSTCSNCKTRERYCQPCFQNAEFIRCTPFENLAAMLVINCRYYDQGCPGTFRYLKKKDHEPLCKYRPYKCPDPLSKCAFSGDIPTILDHLVDHHKLKSFSSSRINVKCSLRLSQPYGFGTRDLDVYSFSDQHFCFHFEAMKMPKDIVYIAFITFLGDDSDGKDFRYRLEVNNGSRKMAWVGVPRSIRDGQKKVRESGHGLIIHSSVAKIFCATTGDTDNQEVMVTGRIWKEH